MRAVQRAGLAGIEPLAKVKAVSESDLDTAVAMYERMVRQAGMEARDLLVVFSRALYAPPFKCKAPTTSAYMDR